MKDISELWYFTEYLDIRETTINFRYTQIITKF